MLRYLSRSASILTHRRTPSGSAQDKQGFTLIELLVVIAIVGILSLVVILVINPADLLRQTRDTNRLSDMDTLNHALNLYQGDVSVNASLGNASTTYFSLIDTTATTTSGTNCANVGLTAPSGWTYRCAASSTLRNVDGTGWLPVNFTQVSFGSPLATLPVDPVNTSSSGDYYSYAGGSWALSTLFESQKYLVQRAAQDGGYDPGRYETGSDISLIAKGEGLMGWWPMDEGSGATASDQSGNGNTGTLVNSPSWVSGKIGQALTFNGSTQDITTGKGVATLCSTTVCTLSAWIYPTGSAVATGATYNGQGAFDDDAGDMGIYRANISGTDNIWVYNWDGNEDRIGIPYTANTWTHIVWVHTGGTLFAYKNGVLVGSTPSGTELSPGNITIGRGYMASGVYWSGSIDDARVYNRALSAAEIMAIYNATK